MGVEGIHGAQAIFAPLLAPVPTLTSLRSLRNTSLWVDFCYLQEDAALLAGATQLTSLSLTSCRVPETVAAELRVGLSGLQELEIAERVDDVQD
jgi:hypothetical protein